MLKVSTIGIGNCGNQIAELAKKTHDIPGIALNSSAKDLTNINEVIKVVLGDSLGAGKDRDNAKKFLKNQISKLISEEVFISHINNSDIIAIISSLGGGTGSGMAPILLDILSRKFSDKHFILIEVYPPLRESVAAQQNSVDFLKEIEINNPNAVYMCYDNNKLANLPTSEMMTKVNEEVVEALAVLRGDYLYPTPFNSIDEKDMLKILETPGRFAIYTLYDIKEKDVDNTSLEEMIINVIKNISANVELDRDKIVKRMGIITNLNKTLDSLFNTNMTEIKSLVGEPVESFEHVYLATKGEENKLILIISGLSVPEDRIEKTLQRIREGLEELARTKESSILNSVDTDDIKNLRDNGMSASSDIDLDDILGRY